MGEDGGVAHHRHRLAVVLAAFHEHGLADGGVHVTPPAAVLRHGVLAYVDVGGGVRLVVVASVLADEEVGRVVVVLVLQLHRLGNVIKIVAVGNQVEVRPAGLDGSVELHVAPHVVVAVEHELLLVADFHVCQVEGFGMAIGGTHPAVESLGGRTPCVFDGVEGFLHVGVELVLVHFPVVSDAHVDHEQGMCAQVLGQLQQLVVAQAVAHPVAPVTVQVARSLLDGSHALLPLEAVGGAVGVGSLDVASAGKAHEAWMQVGQHLRQVFAATVRTALEGGREEAHHVKADDTLHRTSQRQEAACVTARCLEGGGHFLPLLRGIDADGGLPQPVAARTLQLGSNRAGVAVLGT